MPNGQQYSSVATQALLTGGISNANTTVNVSTTSGFPATPFTAVLDIGTASQEIVDVTNVSTLTLTITRGVDGSAAQAHSTGATFTHSAIARDLREARSHMDTGTASAGTPIHGLASGSSVVGTTDTQTLSNKTLSSPTINSPTINNLTAANPTITGTVSGAADFVGISLDGTIGGNATLSSTILNNPIIKTTSTSSSPLVVNAIAGTTADLVSVEVNSVSVFEVLSDGALKINNSGTANPGAVVNTPSGSSADLLDLKQNGTTAVAVDHNGQVILSTGPLSVAGITGAVNTSRYVGSTAGGPPTTGTFSVGDWVVDRQWGINWVCTAGGSPGTWTTTGQVLLGTANPTTGSNITFSSIPAYFNNLKLIGNLNANNATTLQDLQLQFNGDTTANYGWMAGFISNGSPGGGGTSAINQNQAKVGIVWGNANVEGGTVEMTIPQYANSTRWKNIQFLSAATQYNVTTSFNVVYGGAAWHNTAAITSISLFPSGGSGFVAGSTLSLYAMP